MSSLNIFNQYTADWFTHSLVTPTAVQEAAWPAIAAGEHTLVSAPTGTGKTLSAFLVFIDKLKEQAREGILNQELQLIYVSPLKSLAGDIKENLRRPLEGISEEEAGNSSDLNIAIRTGDTPQNERRKMIKSPPHILITTPESLYLMITSASGKSILRTAGAIIIDELHALIDSKRGAHLMLTIARLDKLCEKPLQRIGLSATIEPLDTAAKYLSPDPVTLAVPKMKKNIRLQVLSPLSDTRVKMRDPIWRELANTVYAHCKKARSVIVFVEGRMYAEKLAYYINQVAGEDFARTHHGSLSKERRFEEENALREGSLRVLCTTSSMELGIDVGEIDQVFQIGCPRTISSTMQRLGRAGHNPNRTSVMYMFPRTASEGLYCGMTAEVARNGGIEHSNPPRLCFDVLAQHLVSMAVGREYHLSEVMEILPRAYPFREVTLADVCDVLGMLAGDFEHELDIPVRPRILYDRIHDRVEGDGYSRMLAISAGGTIPDKGMYTVKTEGGVKLGELDEEFVYESRLGDKFLLGTFAWQIVKQERDTVIVKQSTTEGAKLPFWKGELKGRGLQTGLEFGKILNKLGSAHENGYLLQELERLGLDEAAASNAEDFLKRQISATGVLPNDQTIIIEHFLSESGDYQMAVHSMFGRQVNAPLAILVQEAARRLTNTDIGCVNEESGFLVYSYGGDKLPEGLLQGLEPEKARPLLEALLSVTPLFNMTFRYNAARALMMGVRTTGRQPLWVQCLRSSQMLESIVKYEKHPIIRETRRECLEEQWDLDGLEFVLNAIQTGSIQVCELYVETLSPMYLPLQWQVEADNMYDYSPTPSGIHKASEEALKQIEMIKPEPEQLEKVSERRRLPEDEKQLHSLLMIEGDLAAGELDVPIDWLEMLIKRGQVKYIEPGLWIAAEQSEEYSAALIAGDQEARNRIVRRVLRYRGAQSSEQIKNRYIWTKEETQAVLNSLCQQGNAVAGEGIYFHAKLYGRAQRETVKNRRSQIKTLPPERYAALMANRIHMMAPSTEQLAGVLHILRDQSYPTALWESVLLPGRVRNYRPELLDKLLGQGDFFWRLSSEAGLTFHRYEDIDWNADISVLGISLEDSEKIIYDALQKRGASFIQMLSKIPGVVSVYDTLLSLVEKGLVYSDSLSPVRQILNMKKLKNAAVRQRVNARVKILSTGRWDLVRPLIPRTIEQSLESEFERTVLLCRETIQSLPWATALETLRIWEYTRRVRRGYFIEGFSGMQFIREKDFSKTMRILEQPEKRIIWLSASDPAQPWGKSLPHMPDRSFVNVSGSAVCLHSGVPVAVFERKGKTLRIFDVSSLPEILRNFHDAYENRHIFPELKRLMVKQYPSEAAPALKNAGFIKEMQDYVLYRGHSH